MQPCISQSAQSARPSVESPESEFPHPLTRKRVLLPPPPTPNQGGTQFRRRDADTLVIYVYYNPSTLYIMYEYEQVPSKSEAYLYSRVVFIFYCLTSISM
jgi:hypothetical protein